MFSFFFFVGGVVDVDGSSLLDDMITVTEGQNVWDVANQINLKSCESQE